jgi:hypothetical protein
MELTDRENILVQEAFMTGRIYTANGEVETPGMIQQKLKQNCEKALKMHLTKEESSPMNAEVKPEIPDVTLDTHWINSKILLPQDGEIVCIPGGIAKYNKGNWYTGLEDPIYKKAIMWNVWCWTPLPKAPAQ